MNCDPLGNAPSFSWPESIESYRKQLKGMWTGGDGSEILKGALLPDSGLIILPPSAKTPFRRRPSK